MRILHTADWHLGVRLHKKDLSQDHEFFFSWLIEQIQQRNINVLLISGDVFDQSNPSAEARKLYFSFLTRLIAVKCKVIITGGNHDSPAVLNGPQEILRLLDIHVIGGVPEDHVEQVVCLKNKEGKVEAVVCAVPYLRDGDIRMAVDGELQEERQHRRKQGMKSHFENVVKHCSEAHKDAPIILMAHLFASGASKDEQKRDITIGGLDAFIATDFPDGCKYVALGHIHRPMIVDGKEYIRYSGSPIPLSFSEKGQQKTVIEFEIENECIQNIKAVPIPAFRNFEWISGTLADVTSQLNSYQNDKLLMAFADVEIKEASHDFQLGLKVHKLLTEFNSDQIEILNCRYSSASEANRLDLVADNGAEIDSLEPLDVLRKKLGEKDILPEQQVLIEEAFTELLNMLEDENQ